MNSFANSIDTDMGMNLKIDMGHRLKVCVLITNSFLISSF